MNRHPLTFFVLLTLLAFTGQSLAAPFFTGCHQGDHDAMSEQGMDCDAAASRVKPSAGDEPQDDQGHAGHESVAPATGDCGHPCFNCPGGTSLALPGPSVSDISAAHEATPAIPAFIPPSHLDGLFRPPIAA